MDMRDEMMGANDCARMLSAGRKVSAHLCHRGAEVFRQQQDICLGISALAVPPVGPLAN